ncbi:hypothetical protein [Terriglobus albidus]|uniref:hypothetical protein n=1 Tax=Terriglobus albidus TaxID=1592106 RepID=UPI0021E0B57B|nr:hypothetical protein [Terriglobus albidus]
MMAAMKPWIIFCVVLGLSAPAFAIRDGHKVSDSIDKYSGSRIVSLTGVPSKACPGDNSLVYGGDVVTLEFVFTQNKDGSSAYSVVTRVVTDVPVMMMPGDTMDMLIDNRPIQLKVSESTHTEPFKLDPLGQMLFGGPRGKTGLIYEITTFALDSKEIDAIGGAASLQFRTNGTTKRERCVGGKNLKSILELQQAIGGQHK